MDLLTSKSVWLFKDFKSDDSLNGTVIEFPFDDVSEKEGICYKDSTTLYITDENSHGSGGNLYVFSLKLKDD